MKIRNITMVNFINGYEALAEKNLPNRLAYALDVNRKMFATQYIEAYVRRQQELSDVNDYECINELINVEIDANVQTVPISVLERMDEVDKYDALTAIDMANISFMISDDK